MGKREKKTGKGRLDKYYKLAKEQGYRARSAFKLIQLDKKYDILRTARCLIDLCAAPGGWLQVATKYMPPNSIIVGVDLVPIKPIPRVTTFAEDITTDACRRRLREEIKDWKADVVLHDGAPNVGTAWAQDAFTQSELVLSSMKLATEFLVPGGTFVTKVFRSKDYNSLLWVFNQLFSKVEATKPPSSRNVSAEIFVVCTGFLAPKKIDPRLLNPTHVFKDLDVVDIARPADDSAPLDLPTASTSKDKLTPAAFSVFHPDKKRRAREGYSDGDLTLFKRMSASQFIAAADPISILGSANQLDFEGTEEDRLLAALPETTDEIKASAVDLRVLGKKDFKTLLRWHTAVRSRETKDSKPAANGDAEYVETATVQAMTEDEQMALDIERLETEETAKRRKDRRKTNEKRARGVQRMQLHMTTPMDLGLEAGQSGLGDQGEDFVFDLTEAEGNKGRTKPAVLRTNEADDLSSDGEENEAMQTAQIVGEDDDVSDDDERRLLDLEENLDELYDEYQNHKLARDAKHRVKEARKKRDAEGKGEWGGIRSAQDGGEKGEGEDDESVVDSEAEALDAEEEANTLAYQQHDPDAVPDDEVFSDVSDDDAEDIENRDPRSGRKAGKKLVQDLAAPKKPLEPSVKSRAAAMWFDQPVFKGVPGLEALMQPAAATSTTESKKGKADSPKSAELDEDAPKKPTKKRKHMQSDPATWDDDEAAVDNKEEENAAKIAKYGLTTAEAMTLAHQLVNREKTKTQLIDDGFNRNMLAADKEGLPAWFLDDEMKHFRHNIPVTKEAVEAIRAKMRTLNARPIKKIAEAKARKKMRTLRRLAKSQKKADVINEAGDLTEREKASQIQTIISKASKEPKKAKPEVKVVVARGAAKGLSGRPKGVKGRYKMVDSRGKKEMRALKRIQRRDAGKRRK